MNFNAKKMIIVAMTIFLSMVFIDETGVAVVLPQIKSSLSMSDLGIQWTMNGMFLPLAVFVLFAGRLSDYIGYRKVFTLGMVLFLIASVLCAFAPSGELLIVGRIVQGVGASLLLATYAVIISMVFPESERGVALGTCASLASVFLATGPLISGLMVHYLSWRCLFIVNLPLGLASLYFVFLCIEKDNICISTQKFDYLGFGLFTAGFTALIFALMQAVDYGWTSIITVGLLISSFIFLTKFLFVQSINEYGLVDLTLFKNKTFLAGNVILLCTQVVVMSLTYWAIWLQVSLRFTALHAGIALLPAGLPILVTARLGGRLLDKHGPRVPITIGAVIVLVGMLWLASTAHYESYQLAVIGFLAYGIGAPLIISPAIAAILSSVEANKRGMASGIFNTMRQLGASLCFAIVGVVITNTEKIYIIKNYTTAFQYGMFATAIFAFIATVFAFVFLEKNVYVQ